MSLKSLRKSCDSLIESSEGIKTTSFNPYNVPEDFKGFAHTCQIRSGVEFVPFDLFDYQVEISNLIDTCKGTVVWKTRQTGFSEIISCKMLHQSLLFPAFLGAAFSLGQSESSKLSDRVGAMPVNVPGFRWEIDSKMARKSELGGELLFRPSTANAARSLASLNYAIFDECGFPPEIEAMYSNSTPAQAMVGDRARRILGTTIPPEGMDCWFGRTFWNHLDFDLEEEMARVREGRGRQDRGFSYWVDEDGWARILLHWWSHPIYSIVPNRLEKIRRDEKLTESALQREHNLGIPQQSGSLFHLDAIKPLSIGAYLPPCAGRKYLVGVDPNFGGADFWVVVVWDITQFPCQLVWQYREADRSTTYSREKTLELMDAYQPILTAVESNSGGKVVVEDLIRDRPNLNIQCTNTSHASKRVNTDRVALALEQGEVIFPEEWEGAAEMRKFSATARAALPGYHDDCIMAWAAAWAWLDEAISLEVNDYSEGVADVKVLRRKAWDRR